MNSIEFEIDFDLVEFDEFTFNCELLTCLNIPKNIEIFKEGIITSKYQKHYFVSPENKHFKIGDLKK